MTIIVIDHKINTTSLSRLDEALKQSKPIKKKKLNTKMKYKKKRTTEN